MIQLTVKGHPEVRQIVIIANRRAGSFSQQRFDNCCSTLEAGGVALERYFCRDFAGMTEKSREISGLPDSPAIVAAGGDGTINAVFNGLAGTNATCAILPMGTANVMALELGIESVAKATTAILSGVPQPFTAGLLHNADRSSRFFLMAGVGFDGHIVRGVSLKEKSRFGKGAYLLSALRSLVAWDAGVLQVTTATESFSCGSLIICNASRYGGSFSLAPSASMFSPTFEIIAITQSSRSAAIRGAACTAVGRSDAARLYRTTAAKIKIVGVKPVQADGDDWGDAPVELLAEPHYAKIIL